MQIRKQFKFEAAHVLPYHPGKCARMHGHSYRFDVLLEGPLQTGGPARGMVVDFDTIAAVVKPRVVDRLDHTTLNEFIDNPTAERVALWIWNAIADDLPQLVEVVVWETATASAIARSADARPR